MNVFFCLLFKKCIIKQLLNSVFAWYHELSKPRVCIINTDLGFDNSWYHAQPHPILLFIVLQFLHIILYYSLLNSPRWLNTVTGDETGLTSHLGSIVRTLFTYNTNHDRTVNYPFCSPQQSLNNLQYHKTMKNSTTKSTLCTSWVFFASKYGIFLERKCCMSTGVWKFRSLWEKGQQRSWVRTRYSSYLQN